jgi:hypothetical protein
MEDLHFAIITFILLRNLFFISENYSIAYIDTHTFTLKSYISMIIFTLLEKYRREDGKNGNI